MNRFSRGFAVAYGIAHAGKSLFWHASELLFAYYLTEACGLPPREMGLIVGASLALSALADLVAGLTLRHRVRSVISAGKAQLQGAVLSGAAFAAFGLSSFVPQGSTRLAFACCTLVAFRLTYALLDNPQNALLSLATSDDTQGARLTSVRYVIYRDLPVCGFARKVTALPTSSYHMTIFGGANDQDRARQPWPQGVPIDAPIETCNAMLAQRLSGVRLACELPFRMVVDERSAANRASPITLHLQPADAGEAAKLRQVRNRIADALKMRAPDHDRYQFHITIGYQIDWFTAAEQREYEAALLRWRTRLMAENVVFELGAPEYCVFEDMFAFRRQFALSV